MQPGKVAKETNKKMWKLFIPFLKYKYNVLFIFLKIIKKNQTLKQANKQIFFPVPYSCEVDKQGVDGSCTLKYHTMANFLYCLLQNNYCEFSGTCQHHTDAGQFCQEIIQKDLFLSLLNCFIFIRIYLEACAMLWSDQI